MLFIQTLTVKSGPPNNTLQDDAYRDIWSVIFMS
jgi:hypothetical protein